MTYEAMSLNGGNYCPIVRAMPNKPIDRGLKWYVLVDNATNVPALINLCDGVYNAENCKHLPYGAAGYQMYRLIAELPGEGYLTKADNYYGSEKLGRAVYNDLRSYMTMTVREDRLPDYSMRFSNAKAPKPTRACPNTVHLIEHGATPFLIMQLMQLKNKQSG